MHLSLENLRELAQRYYREELLSDKQLKYKKHMAECDVCYEKFCAEYVIQKTLLDSGLIQFSALKEFSVSEEEEICVNIKEIKCKLINGIDGLKRVVEEKKDQVCALWNFYSVPRPALSRGEEVLNESEMMENEVSDYSYIKKTSKGILFRLDGTDFKISNLRLLYIVDDVRASYPFVYNEQHDCYDVRIEGEIPVGAEFQIVEVSNEDR